MFQNLLHSVDIEILGKLLLAAFLGLVIGLERKFRRKPFGLKTSLVISIVSCLLTVISIQSAYYFPDSIFIHIQMDPLRLAAQIVSGIGFLGAGIIMQKENDTISGLTTAAIAWGAAGIGIAIGAGYFIEAIAGSSLLIISVEVLPVLIRKIGPSKLQTKELLLKMTIGQKEYIGEVIKSMEEEGIEIRKLRIKDQKDDSYLIEMKVNVGEEKTTTELYYQVSSIHHIVRTEIMG